MNNDNRDKENDNSLININLHLETIQAIVDNDDLEDFKLKKISNYKYKRSYLYLLFKLKIRSTYQSYLINSK